MISIVKLQVARFIATVAVVLAALATPTLNADSHIDLNFKLQACAALEPDDKRLECYDRIARQHDQRRWLGDQFNRLAEHFGKGGDLLADGDVDASVGEFRSAFTMVRQADEWDVPILSLSDATRSVVIKELRGDLVDELNDFETCASALDYECIIWSAWNLASHYAMLGKLVEDDVAQSSN